MPDTGRDSAVNTGTDAVVHALQASWPILMTLRPGDLPFDINGDGSAELVRVIRELSDSGLVTYEALVVGSDGAQIVDVGLTARGRAHFGIGRPETA